MIRPVPSACILTCDNCKREFCHDTRHVFKTRHQALMLAGQDGWHTDFQSGYALCPECAPTKLRRYGAGEVRKALAAVSRTYLPQVGEKDSKERILQLLAKELAAPPSDLDLLWEVCTEYNLVWYDEYSGIYKANL